MSQAALSKWLQEACRPLWRNATFPPWQQKKMHQGTCDLNVQPNPALIFSSKDNSNLVVPVSDTVPSHALLCCPIFHNSTFFQG